jgi:hypothetical protein
MASPDVEIYAALAGALEALGVRWYLFGAQAAILHGAVRFTEDIDITVELGGRSTRELRDALGRAGFAPRVSDPDDFVERTRVLPCVYVRTALPVDVVVAGPGLEETFLERATVIEIETQPVSVASVEDVIIMKVLAGRPKDIEDVVAMVAAQHARLDLRYVRTTLQVVEEAIGQDDLTSRLEECLRRVPSDSSR